jgi:putative transport protein
MTLPIWFHQLLTQDSPAHAVFLLSIAVAIGIGLGRIKVFGISIGIAGVLFAGILVGHFGGTLEHGVLHFARELGLILFVFSIGLSVGPGFFASFRKTGLKLNLLAAAIVFGGVFLAAFTHLALGQPVWEVIGVFCGAVTNTPSLGAAQQAMKDQGESILKGMQALGAVKPALEALSHGATNHAVATGAKAAAESAVAASGMGYAVAYPFGILGIILTMLLLRPLFGIKIREEVERWRGEGVAASPAPQNFNFEVKAAAMEGLPVGKLVERVGARLVVTRLLRGERLHVPGASFKLSMGDLLHVVAPPDLAEKVRALVGDYTQTDIRKISGGLEVRTLLVTRKETVGQRLADLNFLVKEGVIVSRIHRSGLEFVPSGRSSLELGDQITVVGEKSGLDRVTLSLGNSPKDLQHPNVLPLFIGVLLGVLVGSLPLAIPGLPAPVKLGLAGGPLIVAIALGWMGRVGPISFYVPAAANLIMREAGIVLFLACVGIHSGAGFFETLIHGKGLVWMSWGVAFTAIPILTVGILARALFKLNYLQICGLLAGSMTDPPALGFANAMANSEAQAVTYVSVYPFTTFLRILTAQVFVIYFLTR